MPIARALAIWAAVSAAVLVLMASFADRLLYFPTFEHDGGTPAALGLAYEDVLLQASDGVRLHAWFVPAPKADALSVLFLHGNAGNISHRLEKLAVFAELGAAVLMLDYRGYGRSEGTPDEPGTYRDAEAAYDWLRARIGHARIVAYGESLGGPIAADLATHRQLAGLILESAPASIRDVARHHYPFLPVALFLSARYDALGKITAAGAPILIMHSPGDEIVPFHMAEQLYEAAHAPKRLVRLRGGHNDAFATAAVEYQGALGDFFRQLREQGAA